MLGNGAGPNKAGLTIVMYLYQTGFVSGDLGLASAIGWTLALGILVISMIQARDHGRVEGGGIDETETDDTRRGGFSCMSCCLRAPS